MNFSQYIEELRWRGAYVCLGLALGILLGYKQVDTIFSILLEPLRAYCNLTALVSLDMTEAFFGQFHVAFLVGAVSSVPLFWMQVWLFVRPGLFQSEARDFQKILAASFLFTLGALYFTGTILVPQVWSFFLGFTFSTENPDQVKQFDFLPCLWPYLILIVQVFQIVLLTSQIPLLLFLLQTWGWVSKKFLWLMRPWVIIATLSWAAVISPPDLISQLLIFGPVFFIYEAFIYSLFVRQAFRKLLV